MPTRPRLLIINSSSPYFFNIPMGTFGLCDFLDRHGIEVTLFNPALYPNDRAKDLLLKLLRRFSPSHVGLVLHWQETAHGFLQVLQAVRQYSSTVPVFAGGFTASYFGTSLLASLSTLDFVIQGDPEQPVLDLLQGEPLPRIANLLYRQGEEVVTSPSRWLAGQDLLNSLSFSRLDFLIDNALYLQKCENNLGFPVFVGRGCIFDCDYCGGSRSAFAVHSHRKQPVVRSIAAIVSDLHQLAGRVRTLYLCYENDPAFMVDLLRHIADQPGLRQQFALNYGAWHLPDRDFLDAYVAAFQLDGNPSPLFEFSPEICNHAQRTQVKRGAIYALDDLERSMMQLQEALGGRVRIGVFFSRYHLSDTVPDLPWQELAAVQRFKLRLLRQGLHTVHVRYDHLSTDVASRYWRQWVTEGNDFPSLLKRKEAIDNAALHPFPVNNLCLHIPHTDDPVALRLFEACCQGLELLARDCRELYYILCQVLGDEMTVLIRKALAAPVTQGGLDLFALDCAVLLPLLEEHAAQQTDLAAALPCLRDLFRFSTAKHATVGKPAQTSALPAPLADNVPLILDQDRLSIHEHDYLALTQFLTRLEAVPEQGLPYERTVYCFLTDHIVSLSHRLFRQSIAAFNVPLEPGRYFDRMEAQGIHDTRMLRTMVEDLHAGGLLIQAY